MKPRTQDLALAALTLLVVTLCFLMPSMASATERELKPVPRPAMHNASATATATGAPSTSSATANAAPIDLSLMNNPVAGDTSFRTGNSYSIVSGAAPLPPGLCPKGQSVSVLLGLFAWSTTGTEHECLDKVLAYAREAIPKPQPAPVTNYVTNNNYPAPIVQSAPAECQMPAAKPPARKASAPKKAAPACKP